MASSVSGVQLADVLKGLMVLAILAYFGWAGYTHHSVHGFRGGLVVLMLIAVIYSVLLGRSAWDDEPRNLSDRTPIEAWVEIKKPAEAVWPALVREYEGWTQRRSIWTFGFPELHHKNSSSRETIVLVRLGAS